jgi:hypothetical protein
MLWSEGSSSGRWFGKGMRTLQPHSSWASPRQRVRTGAALMTFVVPRGGLELPPAGSACVPADAARGIANTILVGFNSRIILGTAFVARMFARVSTFAIA